MPDLNQPVEVVVLYPGPTFEVPPFPLIRVAKEDVPSYLAQGWVTEAPGSEEDDDGDEKPKKTTKKK